jgi:hypothetical protein
MNIACDELSKDMWGAIIVGKCPHCSKNSVAIRKEGYNKFFITSKIKAGENNSAIKSNKTGFENKSVSSDNEIEPDSS